MPDHDYEAGAYGVCRRCGEEQHGPAGSDPMPPFPQEPAFGSPEAVAQAAGRLQNPPFGVGIAEDQEISAGLARETIRGFTPGTWRYEEHGQGLPLVIRAPDDRFASGRLVASIPAGFDASPSYATQLWTAFPDAEANARLIAAAPDLLRERDALRAELDETGGIQAMARLNKKLTDQRDALAAALESLGLEVADFLRDLSVEMGEDRRGRLRQKTQGARAALRLAGRLPEVADGPHS